MVSIVCAQDLGTPADYLDGWLDEEVIDEIESNLSAIRDLFDPEGEYGSLFGSLRAASRQFSGIDDELLDPPQACGTADGSGGVPRIGGGGDLGVAPESLIHPGPDLSSRLAGAPRLAVIDEFDFSAVVVGAQASMSDPSLGQANPWSDWLGYRGWESIDSLDEVPHGHFVTFHLLNLARAEGVEVVTYTMDDAAGHRTDYAVMTTGPLTVWLVDIDFDDISTAVWAIRSLETSSGAPTVLNLSWYIIDCDIRRDYERMFGFSVTPEDQLVTNLSDHFHKTSEQFIDEYGPDVEVPCNRVLSLVPDAPDCSSLLAVAGILDMQLQLATYTDVEELQMLVANTPLTVVAAAGNEGWHFASQPASWPSVVGVSACEIGVAGKAGYSNQSSQKVGAVSSPSMGPGSRFALSPRYQTRYYWGTSFASPHVALLLAANPGAQLTDADTDTLRCESAP